MRREFTGEPCVYCGVADATTDDHVMAKKFFLISRRDNLPIVPACEGCNRRKRNLESYLMTVLPFGGRHPDALEILKTLVPRRLAKNIKLHRHLASRRSKVWRPDTSGLILKMMALPIDGQKVMELVEYLVRGLAWHHWRLRFDASCFIEVHIAGRGLEAIISGVLDLNAKHRLDANLGNGTLRYLASQAADNPTVTAWAFSIYGGVALSGGRDEEESSIIALTGPLRVRAAAATEMMRAKRLASLGLQTRRTMLVRIPQRGLMFRR